MKITQDIQDIREWVIKTHIHEIKSKMIDYIEYLVGVPGSFGQDSQYCGYDFSNDVKLSSKTDLKEILYTVLDNKHFGNLITIVLDDNFIEEIMSRILILDKESFIGPIKTSFKIDLYYALQKL
jgi:hypothetical protein